MGQINEIYRYCGAGAALLCFLEPRSTIMYYFALHTYKRMGVLLEVEDASKLCGSVTLEFLSVSFPLPAMRTGGYR
jgi:hypothetical protein